MKAEKYSGIKAHLVLMDITMPEMDGIEALKKIKAADWKCFSNYVLYGTQAMVIESIQSGAKDFIVKPFQADRNNLKLYRKLWGPCCSNWFKQILSLC